MRNPKESSIHTLTRRNFIRLSSVGAAGVFSGARSYPLFQAAAKRPNILFISVDDLRPELGCYGNRIIRTPHIDRLAQRGMVFNRAYCQQAICNPSRSSLLTGLRPDTIRVWDLVTHFRRHSPGLVTLPQYFKQRGYISVSVGKTFHDTLPDEPSWSRPSPEIPVPYLYASPSIRARQQKREAAARKLGKSDRWIETVLRGPSTEGYDAPDSAYRDGALAEIGAKLLGELKETQPFFLALGFQKPHLPLAAPKKYWELYDPLQIPPAPNNYLPRNAPAFAVNSMREFANYADLRDIRRPLEGGIAEAPARRLKHGYYACVSFIDAQIGKVLDELDRLGLSEDTIVVLWGDHGWKLGEHGSWGKQTNYEVDTRSTLILSAPGIFDGGKSTSALVEFVDVYPTLCELAGFKIPGFMDGDSMAPLLKEPGLPWKTAAFSQFQRGYMGCYMGKAMRTDRYRFVEWRDWYENNLVAYELYDHKNDPGENDNIAVEKGNQELIGQLSEKLRQGWMAARPKDLR